MCSLTTVLLRYDVAVGDYPGSTSMRQFESVGLSTKVRIDHLQLRHGSTAYVAVRGFNSAGLSSVAVSDGVVINSKSFMSVWDGLEEDIDFQPSTSVIAASWSHNVACAVMSLSWAIYRVDDLLVQPFTDIPVDSLMDIAEELSLRNEERYYVVVRLVTALGETVVERSDGVTVDIESPVPGQVFDGADDGVDANYQASVTALSATWLPFGLPGSSSPSQQIVRYEVALGSDDRYSLTRINVVPFTVVGLNRSVTFRDLNLIPLSQQYFFTVRAFSKTGAMSAVTSNGIYVGYGNPVFAGSIHVDMFSNSSSSLTARWDGFSSDLPILFYEWAISSNPVNVSKCPLSVKTYWRDNEVDSLFDVKRFVNVGLDTVATVSNLNLYHNQSYYVTVRATNEALRCISSTSLPILIDLTPPTLGIVMAGFETDLGASYIQSTSEIAVTWKDFSDSESGITLYEVSLWSKESCSESDDTRKLKQLVGYLSVGNATSYVYKQLSLDSLTPYYVLVMATNGAGSKRISSSKPVLVDISPPSIGQVKDGSDWMNDKVFQSSLDTLEATFTVAYTEDQLLCPSREYDMSNNLVFQDWMVYTGSSIGNIPTYDTISFTTDQLSVEQGGLKIGWVRERGKVHLRSGAVYTTSGMVADGSFLVEMKTARGKATVTSVVLWDGPQNTIGDLEAPERVQDTADVTTENLNLSDSSTSGSGSGSGSNLSSNIGRKPIVILPDGRDINRNNSDFADTKSGETEYDAAAPSIGFQVMGESEASEIGLGQSDFYLLFWCRFPNDEEAAKLQWVELGFDPTSEYHTYAIGTRKEQIEGSVEWAAELYVDNELRSVLTGIPRLSDNTTFSIAVRTSRGFVAPLGDPFQPPSSFALIRRASLPAVGSHPCYYGEPFRDFDSPILFIESCISSEPSGTCDVIPFRRKGSVCVACREPCDRYSCFADCDFSHVAVRFYQLVNLTLSAGIVTQKSNGVQTSDYTFRPSVYYFVLRVINAAGVASVSVSDGVVIDTTAAICSAVYQVDPSWSLTEPAQYQGTNTSIAAFWECSDNISGIVEYSWSIATNLTSDDQQFTSVGMATSALRENLVLHQKSTYYVSVRTHNGAQLFSTWHGEGITVDVEPPDVSNTSVWTTFSEGWLNVSDILCTDKGDRLGIAWTSIDDDDVELIGEARNVSVVACVSLYCML